jgi:starch phosphorylase
MKAEIGGLCHYYNTHRMVGEYARCHYMPAAQMYQKLGENDMERARKLARWKAQVRSQWPGVSVLDTGILTGPEASVGEQLSVRAEVSLGELTPKDVRVQLVIGRVNRRGEIVGAEAVDMHPVDEPEHGLLTYEGVAVPPESGLYGYALRVLPYHEDLATPFIPGLIRWAQGAAEV